MTTKPLGTDGIELYQAQKYRNISNSNRGAILLIVVTAIVTAIIFSMNHPSYLVLLAVIGGADLIAGYLLYRYRHKDYDVTLESTLLLKNFYLNGGRNIYGRTLDQILECSDEEFDQHIQWILPTTDRSQYDSTAPLMTEEVATALVSHRNTDRVFNKILSFYSLEYTYTDGGSRGVQTIGKWHVYGRSPAWLTSPTAATISQIHLRMTRLITFLKLIGRELSAWSLIQCLEDIIEGEEGLMYQNLRTLIDKSWKPALKDKT